MLDGLTRWILARPRRVVIVWVVAAILCGSLGSGLFGELANRGFFVAGSESDRTASTLADHVPGNEGSQLFAVITAKRRNGVATPIADTIERRDTVTAKFLRVSRGWPDITAVEEVTGDTEYDTRRPWFAESVAVISMHLDVEPALAEKRVPAIRDEAGEVAGPSATVGFLGGPAAADSYSRVARRDLARAEQIAIPATFAVLLIAFLSPIAAALPILLAVITLAVTFALLYLVALNVGLNVFVTNIASVIALGLAIDFSLFMVTRFREEMRRLGSAEEALIKTMTTTGRAVLVSGATIGTALLSLFAVGLGIFSSMALGAAVATLVAVLAAITLFPAVALLLAPWMDKLELRRLSQAARGARAWRKVADVVVARPAPAAILSLAILTLLAIPALSLDIEQRLVSALPDDDPVSIESRRVARLVGPGSAGPVDIVTRQDGVAVSARVRSDPNVDTIWRETPGSDGWTGMQAVLKSVPDEEAARKTVTRLRSTLGSDTRPTYVGGLTARDMDMTARIEDRAVVVVAIAVVLALIALAYGLRSIVIPVKAVVTTLLSVAATLGILLGLGLGSSGQPALEFFVPLFLFAVVFGLSVDYEVFLLSRIREAVLEGHSTPEAVKLGLVSSARSITLAGLALATVFTAFAMSSLDAFTQLGIGVAVAILIDVTLVRCVLVPATVVLFGKWNWWFPGDRRPEAGAPG